LQLKTDRCLRITVNCSKRVADIWRARRVNRRSRISTRCTNWSP